jgi:hypothetical protein
MSVEQRILDAARRALYRNIIDVGYVTVKRRALEAWVGAHYGRGRFPVLVVCCIPEPTYVDHDPNLPIGDRTWFWETLMEPAPHAHFQIRDDVRLDYLATGPDGLAALSPLGCVAILPKADGGFDVVQLSDEDATELTVVGLSIGLTLEFLCP